MYRVLLKSDAGFSTYVVGDVFKRISGPLLVSDGERTPYSPDTAQAVLAVCEEVLARNGQRADVHSVESGELQQPSYVFHDGLQVAEVGDDIRVLAKSPTFIHGDTVSLAMPDRSLACRVVGVVSPGRSFPQPPIGSAGLASVLPATAMCVDVLSQFTQNASEVMFVVQLPLPHKPQLTLKVVGDAQPSCGPSRSYQAGTRGAVRP